MAELRYDLTAPLARYVAENFDRLPKPTAAIASAGVPQREAGAGAVPPVRPVSTPTRSARSVAADAENAMMFADVMERVGVARGQYIVKVNKPEGPRRRDGGDRSSAATTRPASG